MQGDESKRAPAIRLALRVGVTGHRPEGLSHADDERLRAQIREILAALRRTAQAVQHAAASEYAGGAPLLRVVTPLAEGADRLVAGEALALDMEIQCPLPFPRATYERDFAAAASREDFRSLLARASAVFELPGRHDDEISRHDAYRALGRVLLAQSDVLIAIWNGAHPGGPGGTGEIVRDALSRGIPTLWLHAGAPHELRLLLDPDDDAATGEGSALERLAEVLEARLMPPREAPCGGWWQAVPAWRARWLSVYAAFCRMFIGRRDAGRRGPPGQGGDAGTGAASARAAPRADDDARLPAALAAQIDARCRRHFLWADCAASRCAGRYRCSFVLNYLLSALAVLFSLLGYALGMPPEQWGPFIVGELTLIAVIVAVTVVGNRSRWHQRWMEFRLLAEQLRHMRFLLPLGLTTPALAVPGHHRDGDPRDGWGNWYLNAVIREAGLLPIRIDRGLLAAYARYLACHELPAQAAYHRGNARRCARIARRTEFAAGGLFGLTLAACAAHLLIHGEIGRWLTLAAAALPAFSAACSGILNQGEFQRIASRSAAMHERLSEFCSRLRSSSACSLQRLASAAEEAAETMSGELLDWRVIFMKRRLILPN
ncbi:hypothetical protein GPA22_15520 [Aromatoleum toluvorans]|uniref:SMODS and SLOG-associating 2TM effector domain-containing protein n=1 Tax=Aromatoleum toluvorans TaxID=92002 RepID=A0ABX1Q305_9RHOO|nr:hypothetical protein [Aromatoleum toluvorans]NMG45131.1 hypothetical protein [Aromatoleum toluvorans]